LPAWPSSLQDFQNLVKDSAAGGRDERAVDGFVERFAAVLVDAGVPRMPALTFVALLAEDDGRLTADELVDRLRVSRAAVSGAVSYLSRIGLVSRERQPGSRRERYALGDDSWFELVARRERLLEVWVTASRDGVDALGADTPAGRRVAESLAIFEFLQIEMPAMLARRRAERARSAGG
jgi:DNA-binding transcriptional ArsR family regulator